MADYFGSIAEASVLPSADNSAEGSSGRDSDAARLKRGCSDAAMEPGASRKRRGRRGACAVSGMISGQTVAATDEWKPLKRVAMVEP